MEGVEVAIAHSASGILGLERVWLRFLTEEQQLRLGGDLNEIAQRRPIVEAWATLHDVSEDAAVLELTARLNLLSDADYRYWSAFLTDSDRLGSSRAKEAIARNALVLIDQPEPEAYWEGELIEIDWTKHPAWWEFLWKLTDVSQYAGWLDERQFSESTTWKAVRDRKSKLLQHHRFPISLDDLIDSRRKEGHGYRFKGTRDRFNLFRRGVDGRLEKVQRRS